MEIINIEKKAFETMLACFDSLTNKVEMLYSQCGEKGKNRWYGNQDVCTILRISPRSLQTLRDTGKIPFTRINRKIYYKPEDVQKVIEVIKVIKNNTD